MEKNFNIGVIGLESYKKPTIVGYNATRGIIPLAAVGAATAIAPLIGAGLFGAAAASAGAASVAGISVGAAVAAGAAAAAAGAAAGVAATKLAGKITLTAPVLALTARKDFAVS